MLTGAPGAHLPPPEPMPGRRFALLVARFNHEITDQMREGCVEALREFGVSMDDIDVMYVPGAWELPQAAARVGSLEKHDAIITLGCVIRGATSHFDYVAGEAAYGLGAVARTLDVPLIFGVLTTENEEQAWERAARDRGDRGREFALSALHMVALYEGLA